jgi:hypothetical protein
MSESIDTDTETDTDTNATDATLSTKRQTTIPEMDSTPGERHRSHAGSSSLSGADLQYQANSISAQIQQSDFDGASVTAPGLGTGKIRTETNLRLMNDAREAGSEVGHSGLIATVQATYTDNGPGMDLDAKGEDFPLRPGRDGHGAYSEFNQGVIDGGARIEKAISDSCIPLLETDDGKTWDSLDESYVIVEPDWTVEKEEKRATVYDGRGSEVTETNHKRIIRRENIVTKRYLEIVSRVEGGSWMKFVGPIRDDQYSVYEIPDEDVANVLAEFSGDKVSLKRDETGTAVRVYYPFSKLERERANTVNKRIRPVVNWFWECRVDRFYGIMDILGEQNIDIHLSWEDSHTEDSGSTVIPKLEFPYFHPTKKYWTDDDGNRHPTVVDIDTEFEPPSGGQWVLSGSIGVIDPDLTNQEVLDRSDGELNGFDPLFPRRTRPHSLFRVGAGFRGIRISDRGLTKVRTLKVVEQDRHPSLNRLKGHIDIIPPEGDHVPAGISKANEEQNSGFWNAVQDALSGEIAEMPRLPGDNEEEEVGFHDHMEKKQDDHWSWFEARDVDETYIEAQRAGIPFDNIVDFTDGTTWIADQKTAAIDRNDAGQMWANLVDLCFDDEVNIDKYILVGWGIKASAQTQLERIGQTFDGVEVMYRNAYKYLYRGKTSEVKEGIKYESQKELDDLLDNCEDGRDKKVYTD